MRKQITAEKGAAPQGAYSPAIAASGPTLYVSGQGPIDPETGQMKVGTFQEQAKLTFNNITTLLEAAGTSWANVVKVGVYLADLSNFAAMNEIYKSYLVEPYPARTTVQAGLAPNMQIEVDCIATISD